MKKLTEKHYEGGEHVAQCATKVKNSKVGAEFDTSAEKRTRGGSGRRHVIGDKMMIHHGSTGTGPVNARIALPVGSDRELRVTGWGYMG
ncbi:hypothetical protein PIB30_003264 [Stylosanthes scabra]|uniref:Uncharacterized protein n=1 Tax=Stylosanthes scabra TaxID=79078 RepID=A0ABU6R5K8_9FABA|nr:hypothetical protein [Stylosanthes scabra]